MAKPPRFVAPAEIVRRLKLYMPVHIDGLIDPLGNSFSVHRENIMALLTTDIDALPFDSQSIAPFFMEMARAQRACEWGAAQLAGRYTQWKAQRSAEFRAQSEKKVTVAEVESYYRQHDEYEEVSSAPKALEALGNLFLDAKNAFLMKARAQENQFRLLHGHEQTMRFDDQQQRLDELSALEQSAEQAVQASGSALAAAPYLAKVKKG